MKKRIRGIAVRLLKRGDSCEDVCEICQIGEASLRKEAKEDPELSRLILWADLSDYVRCIRKGSGVQKTRASGRKSRSCRHKRHSGR